MQDKVKYRRQDKEELLSGIHLQKLRQAAWQYWHSIHKAPDRAKTIEQCSEPQLYRAGSEVGGLGKRRQEGKIDCIFAQTR